MTPIIKQYLEEHKDNLNNLEKFFDDVYDSILSNGSIADMCAYMAQAGIENINYFRDKALNKILKMCISEFATSRDPSIVAIPINDFIEAYLDNRIGYSVYYVREYMFEHRKEWENLVKIYEDENNIPIIERKKI